MSTIHSRTYTEETVKGWVGSVLFHVLLVLIFYFTHVEESRKFSGFVEVALGNFAETQTAGSVQSPARDVRPEGAARASASVVVKPAARSEVNLPERKFPLGEDVIRLPDARKLDVSDRPDRRTEAVAGRGTVGEKEMGTGATSEGEKLTGEGKRGTAGEGAGFPGSSVGRDIGRVAGYSLEWAGGGTRNKISGDLPSYPEGVNVEAQVRLQAVVAPDGSVKSVYPIQKANERLEETAVRKVRFWKFETLSRSHPQVDQTCTVTFNFKLQ